MAGCHNARTYPRYSLHHQGSHRAWLLPFGDTPTGLLFTSPTSRLLERFGLCPVPPIRSEPNGDFLLACSTDKSSASDLLAGPHLVARPHYAIL